MQAKTILFITGAFIHNSCWDQWKSYFESKGYRTLAPAWPHKERSPEALRNGQPNPDIASNRLSDLTDFFAQIAKSLPAEPILIGHSIGGLIVQILLQRGIGSAGVAIHPVPPLGIFTLKASFLKAGWGALGFFTSTQKAYLMSFRQWQYAFTNGMGCEEQKESYYAYVVPESKTIVRDTITKAARVNFKDFRAPLLITSGSKDHSIPASLNYANYRKYGESQAVTDYIEFKGRNHFVLGQPTWKEDASYIWEWIEKTMGLKEAQTDKHN